MKCFCIPVYKKVGLGAPRTGRSHLLSLRNSVGNAPYISWRIGAQRFAHTTKLTPLGSMPPCALIV